MASRTTTSHEEIRTWAEAQGGKPACVKGTGDKGGPGMLRLMFPDSKYANDDNLADLDWDAWFEAFDANGLALVLDETSRFNKLIARSTAEARAHGESGASVHHPAGHSQGAHSQGSHSQGSHSQGSHSHESHAKDSHSHGHSSGHKH